MSEREQALKMTDNIGVRLHAVEFPNGREAIVTFELFSWSAGHGGVQQSLFKLSQSTQRLLKDDESIDYEGIVRAAGTKVRRDFEHVISTLSERFMVPDNGLESGAHS